MTGHYLSNANIYGYRMWELYGKMQLCIISISRYIWQKSSIATLADKVTVQILLVSVWRWKNINEMARIGDSESLVSIPRLSSTALNWGCSQTAPPWRAQRGIISALLETNSPPTLWLNFFFLFIFIFSFFGYKHSVFKRQLGDMAF